MEKTHTKTEIMEDKHEKYTPLKYVRRCKERCKGLKSNKGYENTR